MIWESHFLWVLAVIYSPNWTRFLRPSNWDNPFRRHTNQIWDSTYQQYSLLLAQVMSFHSKLWDVMMDDSILEGRDPNTTLVIKRQSQNHETRRNLRDKSVQCLCFTDGYIEVHRRQVSFLRSQLLVLLKTITRGSWFSHCFPLHHATA